MSDFVRELTGGRNLEIFFLEKSLLLYSKYKCMSAGTFLIMSCTGPEPMDCQACQILSTVDGSYISHCTGLIQPVDDVKLPNTYHRVGTWEETGQQLSNTKSYRGGKNQTRATQLQSIYFLFPPLHKRITITNRLACSSRTAPSRGRGILVPGP